MYTVSNPGNGVARGVYVNAGGGKDEKGSEGVVQIPLEIIKRISSAAGYPVLSTPTGPRKRKMSNTRRRHLSTLEGPTDCVFVRL